VRYRRLLAHQALNLLSMLTLSFSLSQRRLRMTPNDPTGQNSGFAVSFAGAIQPTTKRCE
jgi:hypothetical protein